MRMIIFVIVIGVLTMIGPNSSFGQNYCDNCPGTSWTSASDLVIADIGTCAFLVHYDYRTCPPPSNSKEIKITSIEFLANSDCSGATTTMLMNQAIRGVLNESRQIFNISNPNNPWDVSVITPMCWYKNTSDMEPCSATPCCSTAYTVVLDDDHYELFDDPDTYSGTTNCNTQSGPGSEVCTDICGSHGIEPEEPLFERYYPSVCQSDCEADWFRDVNNVITTTLGGCTIKAWYDVRDCDPDEYEFRIYKIQWNSNCYRNDVFQRAIAVILGKLYIPISRTVLYLRQQSCWVQIDVGSNHYLMTCSSFTDCCETSYDVSGSIYYPTASSNQESNPTVNCNEDCINLCSLQDIGANFDCYKKSDLENEDLLTSFTNIAPNPTDGKIHLEVSSNETGDLKLIIFDLLGMKAIQLDINKNSQTFNGDFDCSALLPGIYYYRVEINGKELSNGKLILMK